MVVSEAKPGAEPSPAITPPAAGIDVTKLDDKHLMQYRHPYEIRTLATIIVAMAAIVVSAWIFQDLIGNLLSFMPGGFVRLIVNWLHPTRLVPILLLALVAVWVMDVMGQSTRAWQLIARAVEVTPTTFPQLAPIVDELRGRFDLPRTRVFVSRDAPPNGYTVGVREPHAIVLSSITVGSMTPAELKFMLGRHMGSIKLRHINISTFLGSANIHLPMPFSYLLKIRSVLFGAYHHAQQLSCDRIGVIATHDVKPALTCLIKQNIGSVRGAKIDLQTMAPQRAEVDQGLSGKTLKFSQLFSPQPFTLLRLQELTAWAGEPAPAVAAPAAPAAPTPAASAAAAAASAAEAAATAAGLAAASESGPPSVAASPNTVEGVDVAATPEQVVAADLSSPALSVAPTTDSTTSATGSAPTATPVLASAAATAVEVAAPSQAAEQTTPATLSARVAAAAPPEAVAPVAMPASTERVVEPSVTAPATADSEAPSAMAAAEDSARPPDRAPLTPEANRPGV